MPQIHLIEKLRNQSQLPPGSHAYESGNWKVSEARARSLVGGRIYFHEEQASPSYSGGVITSYRVLPKPDPQAGKVVFVYTRDQLGQGVLAGTSGWRNEQKYVP